MKLFQILGLAFIILLLWAFQATTTLSKNEATEQLEKEQKKFFANGQYEAALAKLLEVKTLYEQDENWENVIDCLQRAYLFIDYIPNHQGEIYIRKSVELSNQYLSKHHILKGESYQYLGEIYSINENHLNEIVLATNQGVLVFDGDNIRVLKQENSKRTT